MFCAFLFYVFSVVYSQHDFSSQHWINGSTLIAHAISNTSRINLHYSPQSARKPLITLNYFNISHDVRDESSKEETSSLINDDPSEFNESTLPVTTDESSEFNEDTISFEDGLSFEDNNSYYDSNIVITSNEEHNCCLQADEYLYVKESLLRDIEEYIDRIEQLNVEIDRLNATIRVLERDGEIKNRELQEAKSWRRKCYRRRRKGFSKQS
ncbi:hypothetical protein J6590_096483 [Homalodisca vitripennis]|nr:hypothetical protein J6590_096483 [Homalodisca vitripennis]